MNAQTEKTPKITLFSFCIVSQTVKKKGDRTHIYDYIFFFRIGTIITKIKKKESTIRKIKRKYTQNEMSDAMKFFFCFKIAQLERSQSVNADTFYNQICVYFYIYICETSHYSEYLLLLLFWLLVSLCVWCRFFYFLLERRFI